MRRTVSYWNGLDSIFAALVLLFSAATIGSEPAHQHYSISFLEPSVSQLGSERFDLASNEGIARFAARAEEILAHHRSQKEAFDEFRRARLDQTPWIDLPQDDLLKLRDEQSGGLAKKDVRGLTEIIQRARFIRAEQSEVRKNQIRAEIIEIASAIANNHRSPTPAYIGLLDLPIRLLSALHHPVAKGRMPASNLDVTGCQDLSRADPQSSSYWKRRESIASADLFIGFDREQLPQFNDRIWSYAGPKRAGGNPGCDLISGKERIKMKFGETRSEPFTSRVFHALGYSVDPTDYTPEVMIQYDRRFLREFNFRGGMKMKVGLLFVPVHTFNFQKAHDPFDFIDRAVLKSGRIISSSELKKRLFFRPTRKHPEWYPENFNTDMESEIDYVITAQANVQDERHPATIGAWGFGGLGRENLRELRGAGVLAAWLGWWDSRFENTRLRLAKTENGPELQHFFSDLGGGMGRSGGTFRHSGEKPSDFDWSFTRSSRLRGNGKEQWQFAIVGYEPVENTPAFENITIDDARWMARLIGQLSEQQIVAALTACGFPSAEVRIYTEKLLSRRDQLIRDVQLTDEIPLLRPNGVDHHVAQKRTRNGNNRGSKSFASWTAN
jgi:hypothetical protein